MAIGLSYLLPLEVSFSCWFFFFLRKLEYVPGKPEATGPNPPAAPVPKGSDGKPMYDDSKPYEDRVLNKAIDALRARLR